VFTISSALVLLVDLIFLEDRVRLIQASYFLSADTARWYFLAFSHLFLDFTAVYEPFVERCQYDVWEDLGTLEVDQKHNQMTNEQEYFRQEKQSNLQK